MRVHLEGRGFIVAVVATAVAAAVLGVVVGSGAPGVEASATGPSGAWVITADKNAVAFVSGSGESIGEPVGLEMLGTIVQISDPVDGLQVIVGTEQLAVIDVVSGAVLFVQPLDDEMLGSELHTVATVTGVWVVNEAGQIWRFERGGSGWEPLGSLGGQIRRAVLTHGQRAWLLHVDDEVVSLPLDAVPAPQVDAPGRGGGGSTPPDPRPPTRPVGCPGSVVSIGSDGRGPLVSTDRGLFRVAERGGCTRLASTPSLQLSLHAGGGGAWFGLDAQDRLVRAVGDEVRRVELPEGEEYLEPVVSAGRVWVAVENRVLEYNLDLELRNEDPTRETVEQLLVWSGGVIADSENFAEVFAPGRDGVEVDKKVPPRGGGDGDPEDGDDGDPYDGDGGELDRDRVPDELAQPVREQVAPNAVDDAFTVQPGRNDLPVLRNDSDGNGDPIRVTEEIRQLERLAGVTVSSQGSSVRAQVEDGVRGTVRFEYTLTDDRCSDGGRDCTDTAEVMLEVTSQRQNRAPLAEADRLRISAGTTQEVDVVANDRDLDEDALRVEAVEPSPAARVVQVGDRRLEVTAGDRPGVYRVPHTITDGRTQVESVLIVTVLDGARNQPPLAVADQVVDRVGVTVPVDPTENDSDPDDDELELVRTDPSRDRTGNTIEVTVRDEPYRIDYWISDGNGGEDTSWIIVAPGVPTTPNGSNGGGGTSTNGGPGDPDQPTPPTSSTTSTTTTSTTTTTTPIEPPPPPPPGPDCNALPAPGVNWTGCTITQDLSGANLVGAILNGATIQNSKWEGADLRNAQMTGAQLINLDFGPEMDFGESGSGGPCAFSIPFDGQNYGNTWCNTRVNLTGANLAGATLNRVNLNGSILDGANLTGATIAGGSLMSEASLSGARLPGATLSVDFSGVWDVDLSGADLTDADLTQSPFNTVNLSGTNLTRTRFGTRIEHALSGGIIGQPASLPAGDGVVNGYYIGMGSKLDDADLAGQDLRDLEFDYVSLRGADLSGADLTGSRFSGNWNPPDDWWHTDLSGADLRMANLSGMVIYQTDFIGAQIDGVRLTGTQIRSADFRGAVGTPGDVAGLVYVEDVVYCPDGSEVPTVPACW